METRSVTPQTEVLDPAEIIARMEDLVRQLSNRDAVFESSPDGIVVFDLSGRVSEINGAAEKIFRVSRIDVLGRTLAEIAIAPSCRETFQICLSSLIQNGQAPFLDRRIELVGVRGDGAEFPVELTVARMTRDRVPAFIAYFRDITQGRNAEALLHESENRFRSIFDTPAVGIVYWGSTGAITDANEAFLRMTGYSRADLVAGKVNWLEMTPQEFSHLDRTALEEIVRSGVCRPFEKEYIRKNGTRVPVIICASSLQGSYGRGVATVLDVSDRKKVDAALIEKDHLFRAVLNDIREPLYLKSPGGTFLFRNRELELALQADSTNSLQRQFDEADRRVLATMSAVTAEISVDTGGRKRTFNLAVSPLRDSAGNLGGTVGIARDTTQRRQAEDDLRRSREELNVILKGVQDGVIVQDSSYDTVYANDAAARAMGYESASQMFETPKAERLKTFRPLDRDGNPITPNELPSRKALATSAPVDEIVGMIPRIGGETRWFNVRSAPIRRPGTPSELVVTIFTDITEKRRAETLLQQQSAMIHASMDGLALCDAEGRYSYMNFAHARIYGFAAPDELIGKSWTMLYADAERSRFQQSVIPQVLEGSGVWRGEAVGRRKDGSLFEQEVSLTRVQGGGLACVVRDISHRRREERVARFLDEASLRLGGSLDYSGTVAEIARLCAQFLSDWCVVDLLAPNGSMQRAAGAHRDPSKKALMDQYLRTYSARNAEDHEVVRVVREGRPLMAAPITVRGWQSVQRSPEHRADLEALGAEFLMYIPLQTRGRTLGTITLVNAASSTPFSHDDLTVAMELSRRASLALDNAILYREAQQAIRSRNDLLDIVTHDLRNPLSAALLGVSYLGRKIAQLGSRDDERAKLHVQTESIRRAIDRMSVLIGNFSDLARVDAGNFSLDCRSWQLRKFAQETVEALGPVASARGRRLRLEYALGAEESAFFDRERIGQVLRILTEDSLRNAVKESGDELVLSVRVQPSETVFELSDPARVLSDDGREEIFVRQPNARSSGFELPLAKGIVEAHGGTIECEALEGTSGSRYRFTIPLGLA